MNTTGCERRHIALFEAWEFWLTIYEPDHLTARELKLQRDLAAQNPVPCHQAMADESSSTAPFPLRRIRSSSMPITLPKGAKWELWKNQSMVRSIGDPSSFDLIHYFSAKYV